MVRKPVVFLDIDGVLNRMHSWSRRRNHGHVDRECLRALHTILHETGAQVVLSSSWRLFAQSKSARVLRYLGVRCDYAGRTPHLGGRSRGDEIASWLRVHGWRNFIIVDDDSDMRHLSRRMVKTKFQSGLLPKHIAKAKMLLKSGSTDTRVTLAVGGSFD